LSANADVRIKENEMAIDKAQAKTIQQDVNAALEAVFAKHGLKMVKGRCTYDVGLIKITAEAHAPASLDARCGESTPTRPSRR
jgi:hypothetical protein